MKVKLLIITVFVLASGFVGTVFAEHDPNQPYTHSIILPNDMKEKTFDEFMEWCIPLYKDKCDTLEKNRVPITLSPLKQFKSGIPFVEIQCKQNLILIQKYDGSPACVKHNNIPDLIKRNWTTSEVLMNMHGFPDTMISISYHYMVNLELENEK